MNLLQAQSTVQRLYECRDTAKRLWGTDYEDKVRHTRTIMAEIRTLSGESILSIAIDLLRQADEINDTGSMLRVASAALDLIEAEDITDGQD